jgi:biotin synthase-like enzyme
VLYTTASFEEDSMRNRAKGSITPQLTPTTARDRIRMMSKQNLRKCLYCDYRSSENEEQKKHLREKHPAKMVEVAKKANQTVEWAIGMAASYFTYDQL